MTEIWKPVIWYEWYYEVNSIGIVKAVYREYELSIKKKWSNDRYSVIRKREESIMKYHLHDWYHRITLTKDTASKSHLLHRIVYCSFNNIGLEFKWWDKDVVCHINDIRTDNRLENLYIGSQMDNVRDAKRNWKRENLWAKIWQWLLRKVPYEVISKRSKLTINSIKEIRAKYSNKDNLVEVWKIYWVSNATISRILSNKIRKVLL